MKKIVACLLALSVSLIALPQRQSGVALAGQDGGSQEIKPLYDEWGNLIGHQVTFRNGGLTVTDNFYENGTAEHVSHSWDPVADALSQGFFPDQWMGNYWNQDINQARICELCISNEQFACKDLTNVKINSVIYGSIPTAVACGAAPFPLSVYCAAAIYTSAAAIIRELQKDMQTCIQTAPHRCTGINGRPCDR